MKSILFATDGSPSAQDALTEAIELARDTGAQLDVLTVWRVPIVTSFGYAPTAYEPELVDEERAHAHAIAEAAVKMAEEAGVSATAEVREGDASQQICAFAREHHSRLVVVGSHGWGAFKRLFMGSVSTRVVHDAPCPVLVVRRHEGEESESVRGHDAAVVS